MTSDYDPQRPWYGQISISPELTQSPTPQMLTAAARLAPRGVYVAGNTTSSSGLTVTVVKDASGDFALEAGALVGDGRSGEMALGLMGDQVRWPSD